MSASTALPLLSGQVADSSDADNDTATVTVAGTPGVRHIALGIHADYSAAPASGYKAVTLTRTKNGASTSAVFRHDFSAGPFSIALPVGLASDHGATLVATLAASGTGGVTGRVRLFYISN